MKKKYDIKMLEAMIGEIRLLLLFCVIGKALYHRKFHVAVKTKKQCDIIVLRGKDAFGYEGGLCLFLLKPRRSPLRLCFQIRTIGQAYLALVRIFCNFAIVLRSLCKASKL